MATATLVRAWESAAKGGNTVEKVKDFSVVLTGEGGDVADMPASLFNLSVIYTVQILHFADGIVANRACVGIVSASGAAVLVADMTDATDADRTLPADITGTILLRVTGM